MKNRKGFTIVELVIVIAVIAILAAVLIPTFTTVTKNAKISAAQSQAKNGLDQIIALTGGQMSEGSLFVVDDSGDSKGDYWFAFTKNALKQVNLKNEKNKAEDPTYPVNTAAANSLGYYRVYVSADCFQLNEGKTAFTTDALASINKAQGMLADAVGLTGGSFGTPSIEATGDYYTWDYTVSGETPVVTSFHVYFAAEINDTMVVFIA